MLHFFLGLQLEMHGVDNNYYKINFTNWQFNDQYRGGIIYTVSIQGFKSEKGSGFYYYHRLDGNTATILLCDTEPDGSLTIVCSC